jgi:hypothetical protein
MKVGRGGGGFFYHLSEYQLLNKNFAAWSYLDIGLNKSPMNMQEYLSTVSSEYMSEIYV